MGDLIFKIIDAYVEASNRSRNFLVFLLFSSILIYANCRNTHDDGWFNSRVSALKNVKKYYPRIKNPNYRINDYKEIEYKKAKIYYDSIESDSSEIVSRLHEFEQTRYDNIYLIKIPVIGFVIDINDLLYMGGIILVCFMIIVYYSFRRERFNLKIALDNILKVENPDRQRLYDLLVMKNFFSVPSQFRSHRLLNLFSYVIVVLPLIVYTHVLREDLQNSYIGDLINSETNLWSYRIGWVCEIAVLGLTLACCREIWLSDNLLQDHN
jgi:hypothetical protein